MICVRSSKSALHGMVHWLANAYAKKGITVNGIAPALIQDTKMLPGSNEDLSKSQSMFITCPKLLEANDVFRNPNWTSRHSR